MRKSLWRILVVAAVLLPVALFAAVGPAQKPAPAAPSGRHFLWRVTDARVPFYILGSSHALRASDYPLGAPITDAIARCRRFLFEIDMKHGETELATKVRDAARYPKGVTLKDKVSPKTYAFVRKIAKAPPSTYDNYKPWAIAMFMYSHPALANVSRGNGVEYYVIRHARMAAEFAGLESLDEHVRVLSTMSDIESEVFLLQTLVYGDQNAKEFGAIVTAYKSGDTHRLARLFAPQEREAPYLVLRLITKRNANWVPKVEAEMKTGKPTMVVVGARHLCGPYSLIELLRAKGHKLEQL
ncbi:MAG: TraB/GumN family protein [Verrucomicrobiota bacterium]|nr:TraB/GumN family protein [Verrucomicrobiota bacterium]